jgi:hypothetical protein
MTKTFYFQEQCEQDNVVVIGTMVLNFFAFLRINFTGNARAHTHTHTTKERSIDLKEIHLRKIRWKIVSIFEDQNHDFKTNDNQNCLMTDATQETSFQKHLHLSHRAKEAPL